MCGEGVLVGVGECANSVRTVCEPQCMLFRAIADGSKAVAIASASVGGLWCGWKTYRGVEAVARVYADVALFVDEKVSFIATVLEQTFPMAVAHTLEIASIIGVRSVKDGIQMMVNLYTLCVLVWGIASCCVKRKKD